MNIHVKYLTVTCLLHIQFGRMTASLVSCNCGCIVQNLGVLYWENVQSGKFILPTVNDNFMRNEEFEFF